MKKIFILILMLVIVCSLSACSFDSLSPTSAPPEEIVWDLLDLGSMLPSPVTPVGYIHYDSSNWLNAEICNITHSEYKQYLLDCIDMGYTIDSEKSDFLYSACNEQGYELNLYYNSSAKTLDISLTAPKIVSSEIYITVPKSSIDLEALHYNEVVVLLENAGFTNIITNAVELENNGTFEDGSIILVSINEDAIFDANARYLANVPIIVHYRISKLSENPPQDSVNNPTMVWIPTNGGTKYHTISNCSNMDNPSQVTKEHAERLGYAPCQRCATGYNDPVLDTNQQASILAEQIAATYACPWPNSVKEELISTYGYSEETASYGVSHANIDWNIYVTALAEEYVGTNFNRITKTDLEAHITIDLGFSPSSWDYVLQHADIDWSDLGSGGHKLAAKTALFFYTQCAMSLDEIQAELIDIGFNEEEIEYALQEVAKAEH